MAAGKAEAGGKSLRPDHQGLRLPTVLNEIVTENPNLNYLLIDMHFFHEASTVVSTSPTM
jgi:hypothetical protein